MGTRRYWIILLTLISRTLPLGAQEAEVQLHVVRFPERRQVEIQMYPTRRLPNAEMKAKVVFEEGQSRIEIQYERMKPAVLFGGDISCYVLWAVNRDGVAENLGELWVRPEKEKDSLKFSTGLRSFALMVTAEPYYQVESPSALLLFWNAPSSDPQAPSSQLSFSAFGPAPKLGLETLANVRYDGDTPLDLLQAEKVYEMAGRLQAARYAPTLYREAEIALRQARAMARSPRARRGAQEYARRSVASSNEAIRIAVREQEAKALQELILRRRVEMQGLEAKARAAEEEARRTQEAARAAIAELESQKAQAQQAVALAQEELERARRQLTQAKAEGERLAEERRQLQSHLAQLRQEQEQLRASLAHLQQEKALLENRLQEALSQVAETTETARGFIVSLPDILFDVDQAGLKQEARIVLAKLAGILLLMPRLNLRAEGHTDSTGSAEYNLNLSQRRAQAVVQFLSEQGISRERMSGVGYGMQHPIADNATAEGRRRNRRVEIVIAEGEIGEEPTRP